MGKTRRINKGRIKEEWMHLQSRPAGPITRKTQVIDEDEFESEDFEPDEPFFFENDTEEEE